MEERCLPTFTRMLSHPGTGHHFLNRPFLHFPPLFLWADVPVYFWPCDIIELNLLTFCSEILPFLACICMCFFKLKPSDLQPGTWQDFFLRWKHLAAFDDLSSVAGVGHFLFVLPTDLGLFSGVSSHLLPSPSSHFAAGHPPAPDSPTSLTVGKWGK